MKRIAMFTLIVTAIVAPAVIAEIHSHENAEMSAYLANKLQLTPDQQSTWQDAHREFEAAAQPLLAKHRELGQQIETALKSSSPDACSIGSLMVAQQGLVGQIRTARETMHQKLESVLTPDQKAKFESMQLSHERERRAPLD